MLYKCVQLLKIIFTLNNKSVLQEINCGVMREENMRYCKKCLQPDTNPVVRLNEKQICYACEYEELKKK